MRRISGSAPDPPPVPDIGSSAGADADPRPAAEMLSLLELLISKAPLGFGFVDREFRMIRVNENLSFMNGSTVAADLGRTVAEIVPQLWPQLERVYQHVLDTGEAVLDIEVDGHTPAYPGELRHWVISYYPVCVHDVIIGIGTVVVDITDRKRAEQAGRRMSALVEDSADAIMGLTTGGVATSWNRAAEQMFGYTREEMIGSPVSAVVPAGQEGVQEQIWARLAEGGPAERHETVRRHKDGSLFDVLLTASPAVDGTGHVIGVSAIIHDITERHAAERALRSSRRRLDEAQQIALVGSFEVDPVAGEQTWSDELYRILGIDATEKPDSQMLLGVIHPDDRPTALQALAGAQQHGRPVDSSFRILRADDLQTRHVHLRVVPEVIDGAVIRAAGTLADVTTQVEADRLRRADQARWEVAFEQAGIGAGIVGLDGLLTRVNAAACTLMGRPAELLVGNDWSAYHHPDELPVGEAMRLRGEPGSDTYTDERRFLRPDGSVVWAALYNTLVRDESGRPQYQLVQLQDITARKRMELDLVHQALHDSLTGLANRVLLTDRLVGGLARARRRGSLLGVIFLDLDRFKMVNESLGHARADDLLKEAARRITAMVRPGDTVARFGGDEFVVVCEQVSISDIELIAKRIMQALSDPYLIGHQEIRLTASLGVALATDTTNATPETLLRDSDAAMYLAKSRGRGRIELFDEMQRTIAERRTATANGLQRALERQEFTVHYQPIVDLHSGSMVSVEALLRWNQPGRGVVGPNEFIPVAEETGLIVPIGAWVLEQACRELARWQRTSPAITVAVNLSVLQLVGTDIVALVADTLSRTGVPARSLCLELTESVFVQDADVFGNTLGELKNLGVTVAIDDFGTGYSSLGYLKRFPIDAVKVDRVFVDGLGTDPHDSALVAAIVAMADALGLTVTAEGVETPQQLAILVDLKCQRAQGFHLARPMPAAGIDQLIAEPRRWLPELPGNR